MKLLLLCCSFLFSKQSDFLIIKDECQDFCILEETENYKLLKNKEEVSLLYKDNKIACFEVDSNISISLVEEGIILTYLMSGKIYLFFYRGAQLTKEKVLEEGYFTNYSFAVANNQIHLFGGLKKYSNEDFPESNQDYHKEIDAFSILLDLDFNYLDVYIFGGYLDDFVLGFKYDNDAYYIWGQKDNNSGGELGNAGQTGSSTFLSYFSWEDKILNTIFFSNEIIYDIKVEEQIVVLTNKSLHLLSLDLEPIFSSLLAVESSFGVITISGLALCISETGLKVYSTNLFKLLHEEENFNDFREISHYHNKLIFQNEESFFEFSCYDLRGIPNLCTYLEAQDLELPSIDTKLSLDEVEFTESYLSRMWGIYDVIYNFSGIKVASKIKEEFYANVISGRIYPQSYQIKFNGTGYLNDRVIANNHMIQSPGHYSLRIESVNGDVKQIEFDVDSRQIPLIDNDYEHIDLRAEVNKEFNIIFKVNLEENIKIEKVIINSEALNFIYEEGLIKIRRVESKVDYYVYKLDEIHFSCNNFKWKQNFNCKYCVDVGQNSLEAQTSFFENYNSINCDVLIKDLHSQFRGFNIRIEGPNELSNILISPKDQSIQINDLILEKTYTIDIMLAYEVGCNNLQYIKLFTTTIKTNASKYNLGELLIEQRGLSIDRCRISLNKNKELQDLSANDKFLYASNQTSYTKYCLIGILSSLASFLVIYYLRFFKKKNN